MKTAAPTGFGIFLLSGATLAYEVILVRLLSMTRFHHLAFMVLSLALLGYGASGVLLAYHRTRLLASFRTWFSIFAAMFAAGSVLCFQLSQRIPVFPGEWVWSPFEALTLVALYLVLSLPFFAAACAVGLAYCSLEKTPGYVYRADLVGAAAGSLGALASLWLPEACGLWVPWSAGLAASGLIALPDKKRLAISLFLLAALGPAANPEQAVRLILSPDKPLAIALNAEGVQQSADIFTPLGRITVTRNTIAPYRHAPGLSLAFRGSVGAQWGAFTDGESFTPLLPADDQTVSLLYLDYLPEALAYRIASRPRALLLETSTLENLARAVIQGASTVDVVVSNPGWRSLFESVEPEQFGRYFAASNVRLTIAAPRGFLRTGGRPYDLIVIGPPSPSSLAPDHLHTVEAFGEALARLEKGGLLSVTGPSDLPPRAGLRLLSTAASALKMSGAENPAARLVLIRSLQTVNLMVKNGPLTAEDISRIRAFCSDRLFDPVWFPGIDRTEANRWNRLDTPLFHDGAAEILGPASSLFQERYKFDVAPVFDDRPYFSHFLKLATLKELFALRETGALGLLSFAEPVLAATLLQAALLSLLVVWLPLRRFRATNKRTPAGALYFMFGAGFMLAEFAVMEKMSLFLNEPVLAAAVTLAAFLAMAGLGGGISSRFIMNREKALQRSGAAALLVAIIIVIYLAALPSVLNALMGMPLTVRMALALLLISPLAFAMGFPFPLAVSALKRVEARAVPWAWGFNGCGSMIGPVLGISLGIYGGVTVVLGAAALCYAVAFAATLNQEMEDKSQT